MKKLKTYKQYEGKQSLSITDEMIDEFVEKYNKQFIEFFTNMFNNFRDTLIETIKEHPLNKYDNDSYRFIEHLNSDMNECRIIAEQGLHPIDVEDTMKDDTTLYKKYEDDDEKYNEAIFNLLIQENIRSFNTLKQKELEKEIEENPSRWQELREEIYDYRIYNKFQHLNNANKFDLI